MGKIIRRVLILAGLVAVALVLLNKLNSGERHTPDQLKALLDQTVHERWQAIVNNDWVKVYAFETPETRKDTNLTTYIQGKNAVDFTRFEVKSVSVKGNEGICEVSYDWHPNLEMAGIKDKIDKGNPFMKNVPLREYYRFSPEEDRWFFVKPEKK